MEQQILDKQKTYRERLEELEIGKNIIIDEKKRTVWANTLTAIHRDSLEKHLIIKADLAGGKLRVWRLK